MSVEIEFCEIDTHSEQESPPDQPCSEDAYVHLAEELYRLCGCCMSELSEDQMWIVYNRIDRFLQAYRDATGDEPVLHR